MREFIQKKLLEIQNVDIGSEVPDDLLEDGKTYFSYSIYQPYVDTDYDDNFTYRVNCIGFVKRVINTHEDTLKVVDEKTKEIVEKLKELNIRCSFEDVSISNNIQKIKITGEGKYNEINNKLV